MTSWRTLAFWIAIMAVVLLAYASGWLLYPVWAGQDTQIALPANTKPLLQSGEYFRMGFLYPAVDVAPGDRVDIYGTIQSGDRRALLVDVLVLKDKPRLLLMVPKDAISLFRFARDLEFVPTSALGPPPYEKLLQPAAASK